MSGRQPPGPALLALADGSVFRGRGFGAVGSGSGEVCFNTSMTGYQEILSDPSYAGQIVCMTYTQIGNVGVNPEDEESARMPARSERNRRFGRRSFAASSPSAASRVHEAH